MQKKRITVLGSTGSIGKNTLDVVGRHGDRYEVFALSAGTQTDVLFEQCVKHRPKFAVMVQTDSAKQLEEKIKAHKLDTKVLNGMQALDEISKHEAVDIVMAAIVGAAGLLPCMAAARAGKQVLLANKEALVVGGDVFLSAVRQAGAVLLPIDSEHSAIFQSLPEDRRAWHKQIDKIILTASGGPFRTLDVQMLKNVTPQQACTHPNWRMGRKISVDSATMMNKALEVIEAKYLFDVSPDKIEVVIHPQSIIHSMVQYVDTSIVAQLGTPDMRVPIAYGLAYPERINSGASTLDFRLMNTMTFEALTQNEHEKRYPGLKLAWQSLKAPSGTCVVLNAANEVAVQAFLDCRIRFDQIHQINEYALDHIDVRIQDSSDERALLQLDTKVRFEAQKYVQTLAQ